MLTFHVKSFAKKDMLANSAMTGVILVPDPGLLMRLFVVAAGLPVVGRVVVRSRHSSRAGRSFFVIFGALMYEDIS